MSAGVVTDSGLANIAGVWGDPNVISHSIQFGTGSGQGETATTLAVPAQSAVAANGGSVGNVATFEATITADADRVITEAGLIESETNLLEVYGDFDAIDLAAGDSIVFQINVTVSRAD